jgi:hypothetical protein
MLIVNIIGGLGNQLFQYAFYHYLEMNNHDVKIDDSYYDTYRFHNGFELIKAFKLHPRLATKDEVNEFIHGFQRSKNIIVFFKKRLFDKFDIQFLKDTVVKWEYKNPLKNRLLLDLKKAYLIGYWSREQYFKEIRESLVNKLQFRLDHPLETGNLEILEELKSDSTIAIHVRGGDYSDLARLQKQYYIHAIQKIKEITEVKQIIVFTNDKQFTRNLLGQISYKIVENNQGDRSFIDMYLMSNASNLIIANSTFSWWAAYLNRTARVVVYPSVFEHISDFENWIRI